MIDFESGPEDSESETCSGSHDSNEQDMFTMEDLDSDTEEDGQIF